MKWHLIVNLICISLMTRNAEHLLICFWLRAFFFFFFGVGAEMSIQIFAHLKIELLVFYCFVLQEFFIHSGYKSLIKEMSCKYILPFCGLSVHFLSGDHTEVLNFDEVQFLNFSLVYVLVFS